MEQLVNFIIRPPRAEYDPKNDLLDQEFMLKGKWYQRRDLEIKNSRGDVLQCSHYMPIISPEGKPLPCVIYCHGNSGCRADGSEAAILLLPSNISVFTLDFSGSGLSGGEHVTLGCSEKDDLKSVVDYLRADGNVSLIGLWGRSMGAVTSLMYGAEDPSIAGMVLDSPFSDLVDLMMELVDTYRIRLPKFTVSFAIHYMRRSIQKKAKFDIMDLNTIKVAKSCFVPVLLGHAIDDDFIRPHHSDRIFDAYMGDKNIIKFEGDHNSPRPQFYFDSITIFFHNVLQPPEDEVGEDYFDTMHDYFGKGGWRNLHEVPADHESSFVSKEPSTSSTADAIEQLRSKRPMSRMEVPSDMPSNYEHNEHEDKKFNGDQSPSSSSSKMISFELSNGHPYGPNVPTTLEDDQYVEYQLDDLAGFPCNVEEEERMLMEAVIESLKDMEMKSPQKEDQPPSLSTGAMEPSGKDDQDASSVKHCRSSENELSSSSVEHSLQLKAESTFTSAEHCDHLKSDLNSSPVINVQNLTSENSFTNPSVLSRGPLLDSSSGTESGNTSATLTDSSASIQSSSDADVSASTKATLTVVKNPANHIMDGLMRRWDFSFFRNSNSR
ncbi:Alpha/beta-Hydrolases superfamily protein [Quillaja saponaria]|uniref:Alpha/beta-Hydrolases superfamily protein n=1 Tax=Quillaja saponaria TaxID=32244 RepID=A0AAD7LC37_QUISA|nr:Alpha/beta-Hydrolases superfamily protein [Quillaja saponaria]